MLPCPELSRGNELCSNAVMCELVWDFARTEATFRFLYEVNFRSRVYITIPLDSYTDFSNSMHVTTLLGVWSWSQDHKLSFRVFGVDHNGNPEN
jgi:hypothetical protein